MFRFAGDPVNQIVSLDTPAAERAEIANRSASTIPCRCSSPLSRQCRAVDFGVSYQFRQPVSDLLTERMPATLELAFCATFLALVFGILMGVYSALQRDTCWPRYSRRYR